nr:dsc e3 ubiquitin ligase complex subunit 2 [Quercus suber]
MLASGFSNAPVARALVMGVVITAFLATITDTKYYFWISVRPHILDYGQLWRLFTWQLCYTNSTEVLFAAMTLYQLRVIERLWGSRNFGYIEYLPAGPTPIIFALLAQYHAAIPYIYKYRISGSLPAGASTQQERGLQLTSKATSYILPMQLALSQLPGSALAAGTGWLIGFAYRREILPGATKWRVPGWMIGGTAQKERYDSLRRRMEGEAGRATGVENATEHVRRRGVMGGLVDQFRGAF